MFGARVLVNSRPGASARFAFAPSYSKAVQRSSRMQIVADASAISAKKADAQTLRYGTRVLLSNIQWLPTSV